MNILSTIKNIFKLSTIIPEVNPIPSIFSLLRCTAYILPRMKDFEKSLYLSKYNREPGATAARCIQGYSLSIC